MNIKLTDYPCLYRFADASLKQQCDFLCSLGTIFGLTKEEVFQYSTLFAHTSGGVLFNASGIDENTISSIYDEKALKPFNSCKQLAAAYNDYKLKNEACRLCKLSTTYSNIFIDAEMYIISYILCNNGLFLLQDLIPANFISVCSLSNGKSLRRYPLFTFNRYFVEYLKANTEALSLDSQELMSSFTGYLLDLLRKEQKKRKIKDLSLPTPIEISYDDVISCVNREFNKIYQIKASDDKNALIQSLTKINSVKKLCYTPPLIHNMTDASKADIKVLDEKPAARRNANTDNALQINLLDFFSVSTEKTSAKKLEDDTVSVTQNTLYKAAENVEYTTLVEKNINTNNDIPDNIISVDIVTDDSNSIPNNIAQTGDFMDENTASNLSHRVCLYYPEHTPTFRIKNNIMEICYKCNNFSDLFDAENNNYTTNGIDNEYNYTVNSIDNDLNNHLNVSETLEPYTTCYEYKCCGFIFPHYKLKSSFMQKVIDCSIDDNLSNIHSFLVDGCSSNIIAIEAVIMNSKRGLLLFLPVSQKFYFFSEDFALSNFLNTVLGTATKVRYLSINVIPVINILHKIGFKRSIIIESIITLYTTAYNLTCNPSLLNMVKLLTKYDFSKETDFYEGAMPLYNTMYNVLNDYISNHCPEQKDIYISNNQFVNALGLSYDISDVVLGLYQNIAGFNHLDYTIAFNTNMHIISSGIMYIVTFPTLKTAVEKERYNLYQNIVGTLHTYTYSCLDYVRLLSMFDTGLAYFCIDKKNSDVFMDLLLDCCRKQYRNYYNDTPVIDVKRIVYL